MIWMSYTMSRRRGRTLMPNSGSCLTVYLCAELHIANGSKGRRFSYPGRAERIGHSGFCRLRDLEACGTFRYAQSWPQWNHPSRSRGTDRGEAAAASCYPEQGPPFLLV